MLPIPFFNSSNVAILPLLETVPPLSVIAVSNKFLPLLTDVKSSFMAPFNVLSSVESSDVPIVFVLKTSKSLFVNVGSPL